MYSISYVSSHWFQPHPFLFFSWAWLPLASALQKALSWTLTSSFGMCMYVFRMVSSSSMMNPQTVPISHFHQRSILNMRTGWVSHKSMALKTPQLNVLWFCAQEDMNHHQTLVCKRKSVQSFLYKETFLKSEMLLSYAKNLKTVLTTVFRFPNCVWWPKWWCFSPAPKWNQKTLRLERTVCSILNNELKTMSALISMS